MEKGADAVARRRERSARSQATMVRTAARRWHRSDRSMAPRAWIAAPIMCMKMKSILSHRRRRDVAKPAKSWGFRSHKRMPASLLPFHIVASILSWLPVKSILRFHCVCKEWRSLTCSLNFIKEHHTCARALGRLALISTRIVPPKIPLYNFGDNGEVRNRVFSMIFVDRNAYTISNPVNGLICYEHRNPNRYDECNLYLLNPATRELMKSGTCQWNQSSRLGLGFDSSTGRYKLVKLFHIEGRSDHCGCKVFELGTQEWREVGVAPCMLPVTAPVLLNGAIHWISTRCLTGNINFVELTIVAFNLKDEKFRSIPVPPECGTRIGEVYVVEWEGLLCIVKLPNWYLALPGGDSMTGRGPLVRIWRLEDYATCIWREAHCSILPKPTSIDGQPDLVGIRGHEMLFVTQGGLGSICSYNLRTRSIRVIYNEDPGFLQFLTESLVSLRCLAGNLSPN